MTDEIVTDGAAGGDEPDFAIQRLYIKDSSFEAPNTPEIFRDEWQPEVSLDLQITNEELAEDVFEVVLMVTAEVKNGEQVAFLTEIHQAGVFTINGFGEEQLGHMLGSFCPNILYPYARERISDAAVNGGFPPLYLSPINFDAFYQQHLDAEEEGSAIVTPESNSNQTH